MKLLVVLVYAITSVTYVGLLVMISVQLAILYIKMSNMLEKLRKLPAEGLCEQFYRRPSHAFPTELSIA